MSKRNVYGALAVATMVGAMTCAPMRAQEVSGLQRLYDLADAHSQQIKVSEAALKAAEEGVAAAKSAMLPSVELGLQGSYTGNAMLLSRGFSTSGTTEYIVPGLGPQQVANGKQPTPHWGNSFTAQVQQVVYAGGAIRTGIKMSELGLQLAELDVEKNRQEVRFLLTGYYLDLCKLENQLEVIKSNITLTRKVIEQMKARREQGTALKNDITRYELQLQNLELTRVKLLDASSIIRHQMANTLHLPDSVVINPDRQALDEDIMALQTIDAQESWQEKAADSNVGLRQALLAKELAGQKAKAARAASLPSVALVVENHLNGPYTQDLIPRDANVNVWFIGIGVKYSLSSLWKNNHSIRKAKHEAVQSHEQWQLAGENVENGVQANYVDFLTAQMEVRTQQKQVELAEQNYSVVQNRYDNDLALLTDMLDASNMKLSAEMALVNARITLLYNFYKLKYITSSL